jgi:hypothetical protein
MPKANCITHIIADDIIERGINVGEPLASLSAVTQRESNYRPLVPIMLRDAARYEAPEYEIAAANGARFYRDAQ